MFKTLVPPQCLMWMLQMRFGSDEEGRERLAGRVLRHLVSLRLASHGGFSHLLLVDQRGQSQMMWGLVYVAWTPSRGAKFTHHLTGRCFNWRFFDRQGLDEASQSQWMFVRSTRIGFIMHRILFVFLVHHPHCNSASRTLFLAIVSRSRPIWGMVHPKSGL